MVIGRIYKIIHNQSDVVYVGSTLNILKQRWQQHKASVKRWLITNEKELSIYPYLQEHGIENFKMILIKEYAVCDKTHLKAYEQLWINKLHCCNKGSLFRINRLYQKQWRERNKEKMAEYHRKYNEENCAKLSEYKKKWYEENKQTISIKRKEKIKCECGAEITKRIIHQHMKTKRHKLKMNELASNQTE